MTSLELKRMKLQLVQVAAARNQLEFNIEERLDEVERIKANIKIQQDKEAELSAKIADAEKAAS